MSLVTIINEVVLREWSNRTKGGNVNLGRSAAGSAITGGRRSNRYRRKSVSLATAISRATKQVIDGQRDENKARTDHAKASLARRKAFYRVNDVKQQGNRYHF